MLLGCQWAEDGVVAAFEIVISTPPSPPLPAPNNQAVVTVLYMSGGYQLSCVYRKLQIFVMYISSVKNEKVSFPFLKKWVWMAWLPLILFVCFVLF